MGRMLTCRHCEDVIGVYEPMIVLCNEHARRTSRAAEPDVGEKIGEYYNHACFVRVHGEHSSL